MDLFLSTNGPRLTLYVLVGPNRGIRHAFGRYRDLSILHGMDSPYGITPHPHVPSLQLRLLTTVSPSSTPAILSMTSSLPVSGRSASPFSSLYWVRPWLVHLLES